MPAAAPPLTLPASLLALRRSAADNAAGCATLVQGATAELGEIDAQLQAQAAHGAALAVLAGQADTLLAAARALALQLEQQRWLAQGAEAAAGDAGHGTAEATRGSHAAALAADTLAATASGLLALVQTDDAHTALAQRAGTAAQACRDAALALEALDRSAHDAGVAAVRLPSHPATEETRQAQALATQMATDLDTLRARLAQQRADGGTWLTQLRRQRAERATAAHRAEAEQAGWQGLRTTLPAAPAVAAEPWQAELAAARTALVLAQARHGHRQAACNTAHSQQAEAQALQQVMQAQRSAAGALAPAVQAARQTATEAQALAHALPTRCAAALTLGCKADAALLAAGQAVQALAAAQQHQRARGLPPSAAHEAALRSLARDQQAAQAALAGALPLLAAAQRGAAQADAAAATLRAAADATAVAGAALLAQLEPLAQALDQGVQTQGQVLAAAVTAAAEAQATLVHAQGQVDAAAAAQAAAG